MKSKSSESRGIWRKQFDHLQDTLSALSTFMTSKVHNHHKSLPVGSSLNKFGPVYDLIHFLKCLNVTLSSVSQEFFFTPHDLLRVYL
jgi:hypothetical protein